MLIRAKNCEMDGTCSIYEREETWAYVDGGWGGGVKIHPRRNKMSESWLDSPDWGIEPCDGSL